MKREEPSAEAPALAGEGHCGVRDAGCASCPGGQSSRERGVTRRGCQARGCRAGLRPRASQESGCLRMQPKAGGRPHLRLNTGTRPIANKYREGKLKRTLKREFKSTWNRSEENGRIRKVGPGIQPSGPGRAPAPGPQGRAPRRPGGPPGALSRAVRRDRPGGGQTAGGARPRERGPRAQACRTAEDCRARPPGSGRSPGSRTHRATGRPRAALCHRASGLAWRAAPAQGAERRRRESRPSVRPVLKHGPRSLADARVIGPARTPQAKWKWIRRAGRHCRGGTPRPGRGRTAGPSRRPPLGGRFGGARARLQGPERWWTMPEQGESRGNPGGSPQRFWRANRSSNLGIGAKDQSNHLIAGSRRSFPQDSWRPADAVLSGKAND